MTDNDFFERVRSLFYRYRGSLGLSDEIELDQQCEYEDRMARLLCEYQGPHDFVPDHCGKPEHDYCSRCGVVREDLDDD